MRRGWVSTVILLSLVLMTAVAMGSATKGSVSAKKDLSHLIAVWIQPIAPMIVLTQERV